MPVNCTPQWRRKIPMRDGVWLNGSIYQASSEANAAPAIVAMTPYTCDTLHERGMYFAANGLSFVAVDVRGRGDSGGEFRPNLQEANDGYDVVEWVARQPFCNGKVGMWGASYLGYAQWATAKEIPPHLMTIVPSAAPYMGVDFPIRNNIGYPYLVQWLHLIGGRASQIKSFSDERLWAQIFHEWHVSGRSYADLNEVIGVDSAIFSEWTSYPERGDFWDLFNPTPEQYGGIQMKVLTITGCYDDDQPGALEHYRQHMRYATPEARAGHYLVIGPWDHAGVGAPSAEFGGLRCGPASVVDLPSLHNEWYNWTMAGGQKPAFLKARVTYYVCGAEEWKHADSLDDITKASASLFPRSTTNAAGIFAAGALCQEGPAGAPDSYIYDPRDTAGPEVEAEASSDCNSIVDGSVLIALGDRCVVYQTRPLLDDVEVSGFFKLDAWISIDCPDTDIYVSIFDVAPDGSCVRLSSDGMRARYREDERRAKLVDTVLPLRYEFKNFTFVSRKIPRNHRLRLAIAPVGRLIGAHFTQRNFNAGGVVAEESYADGRPVTVRIFHSEEHPSVLRVPLGEALNGTML